jgi:hypothetical protein
MPAQRETESRAYFGSLHVVLEGEVNWRFRLNYPNVEHDDKAIVELPIEAQLKASTTTTLPFLKRECPSSKY